MESEFPSVRDMEQLLISSDSLHFYPRMRQPMLPVGGFGPVTGCQVKMTRSLIQDEPGKGKDRKGTGVFRGRKRTNGAQAVQAPKLFFSAYACPIKKRMWRGKIERRYAVRASVRPFEPGLFGNFSHHTAVPIASLALCAREGIKQGRIDLQVGEVVASWS